MTEYKEFHCPYGDDFEGGNECDRCEQYELCMETPTADVVERSDYDLVVRQLNETFDRVAELDKLNGDLHSKIDKAIEEIEELKTAHCIQVMDREDIVTTCLDILKRNMEG